MIDNYDKLPIGKFMELQAIDYANMEEIDIQVAIISILTDMDEDDILDLPINEYKKLAQATSFLTQPPKQNAQIPKKIVMDGREYYVISKVEDMSAGQYIDYQTYLGYKDDKYLPHILSCIIIPKGEKYGESDIATIIKTIQEELPITTATSISAFFLRKWELLTRGTLAYLVLKMKWKIWREKNPIVKEKMKEAMEAMVLLKSSLKNGGGLIGLHR